MGREPGYYKSTAVPQDGTFNEPDPVVFVDPGEVYPLTALAGGEVAQYRKDWFNFGFVKLRRRVYTPAYAGRRAKRKTRR